MNHSQPLTNVEEDEDPLVRNIIEKNIKLKLVDEETNPFERNEKMRYYAEKQ